MKTDSEGNTCPFCPENGFVSIIDDTELAYLVQVVKTIDGERIAQVGRYFIIPKQHIESVLERPDDWTKHEKILLWRAIVTAGDDQLLMQLMEGRELTDALNTSWNNGKWAGQLVLHSHMWVIFRYDSLQIGLDGIIVQVSDSRNGQDARALATGGEPLYHEPDDPQY